MISSLNNKKDNTMSLSDQTLRETIDILSQHDGNMLAAAKASGVPKSTFRDRVIVANKRGLSPDHDFNHLVPDGFIHKGQSVLRGKDGEIKLVWEKSDVDKERQVELIREIIKGMAAEVPRLPALSKPTLTNDKLCNVYTFTDYHMGMLATYAGQEWNIPIAEDLMVRCFEAMVAQSPKASHCIIANIGDFLHSDSLENVTPMHKNVLQQDGRYSDIVSATVRVFRALVDYALQHHDTVHLVMAEGNHDLIGGGVWLSTLFNALYENEPRITVDTGQIPYYAYKFGKVMLAWHHGHRMPMERLPLFFATEFSEMWGSTSHRFAHTGHKHHKHIKEFSGMEVEQHQTLASKDQHAVDGGYSAKRATNSICYHREYGEAFKFNITPEMVR